MTNYIGILESCKTAKCDSGKKCIQRNNQPKCVCAPNCKAIKGHSAKRNLRFIDKANRFQQMRVVDGVMKKRKRNSKRLHVLDVVNKDVDFVDSATNSSKSGKSERVILPDGNVFNRINGDTTKTTRTNKSIKNDYVKGNYSSVMNENRRHGGKNIYKQQSNWPSMIRTGSYGYDVPFPSNQFSVSFTIVLFEQPIIVRIP